MALEPYQKKFIDLIFEVQAIRLGSFNTKSGRKTPYFIDMGHIASGRQLKLLAHCYLDLLEHHDLLIENSITFFGPAYKGIPIAVALSIEADARYSSSKSFFYASNRKEPKLHGERGTFIGKKLKANDTVIIVEDILTAGTSLTESLKMLRNQKVNVRAAVVGINRQEKSCVNMSAKQTIMEQFKIPVYEILTLNQIWSEIQSLQNRLPRLPDFIENFNKKAIEEYQKQYCIIDDNNLDP